MTTTNARLEQRKASKAQKLFKVTVRKAKAGTVKSKPATAATTRSVVDVIFGTSRMSPLERVRVVKQGVPPESVEHIASKMRITKEQLIKTIGLSRATVDRKVRQRVPLSPEESSRVLGVTRLIGQVQDFVAESGSPKGFNASTWVANWLETPLAALNGERPSAFMDTTEGQALVSSLIARMQSGAYA